MGCDGTCGALKQLQYSSLYVCSTALLLRNPSPIQWSLPCGTWSLISSFSLSSIACNMEDTDVTWQTEQFVIGMIALSAGSLTKVPMPDFLCTIQEGIHEGCLQLGRCSICHRPPLTRFLGESFVCCATTSPGRFYHHETETPQNFRLVSAWSWKSQLNQQHS